MTSKVINTSETLYHAQINKTIQKKSKLIRQNKIKKSVRSCHKMFFRFFTNVSKANKPKTYWSKKKKKQTNEKKKKKEQTKTKKKHNHIFNATNEHGYLNKASSLGPPTSLKFTIFSKHFIFGKKHTNQLYANLLLS